MWHSTLLFFWWSLLRRVWGEQHVKFHLRFMWATVISECFIHRHKYPWTRNVYKRVSRRDIMSGRTRKWNWLCAINKQFVRRCEDAKVATLEPQNESTNKSQELMNGNKNVWYEWKEKQRMSVRLNHVDKSNRRTKYDDGRCQRVH